MKARDLRDMTDDELEHELAERRQELEHGGTQGSPMSPLLKGCTR